MKKKQPKSKDSSVAPAELSRGRGRGGLETRGRGRGVERGGRGATRGARSASTVAVNGTTKQLDTPAQWDEDTRGTSATGANGDNAAANTWAHEPTKDALESLEVEQPKPASSGAPSGKTGGWASLFAKPVLPEPVPVPIAVKKDEVSAHDSTPGHALPLASTTQREESLDGLLPGEERPASTSTFEPALPPIVPIQVDDSPTDLPSAPHSDTAADMPPPADALTEKNLDKLPDVSQPPATATAASTVASTADPSTGPARPPASAIRPGMSGHAASALRATTGAGRSASYSRKVAEQQEAVVMPGHHSADRAAVQFGKMGLDDNDDAEDEPEDPETRTQMPEDSPAAPRTSLPPSASESRDDPASVSAAEPAHEQQAQRQQPTLPSAPQSIQEPSPQEANAYPDQYRYASAQKPYDPFSQQPQHSSIHPEPFSSQLPGHSHSQHPSQQQAYNDYYAREYAHYYGAYGHTQGQEAMRSGGAFGSTTATDSSHTNAGGRGYGSQDLQASGNNTPAPGQHQASHTSQMQQQQQGYAGYGGYPYTQYAGSHQSAYSHPGSYGHQGQHSQHANQGGRYGANRPLFDDARRSDEYYQNQYGYGQNQAYSSSFGKSQHMYAGPQHGYSHDQYSSSPGSNAFAGREQYGRTGSTQPSEAHQAGSTGASAFTGGISDQYNRAPSGFGQSQHGGHGSQDEATKATGPSPSLQSGRPGSTAQSQQLGAQQGGQQGYGGHHQYGGFGGQNPQYSQYGSYGTSNNAFGGSYGANYGGRNWSGQYGSAQH